MEVCKSCDIVFDVETYCPLCEANEKIENLEAEVEELKDKISELNSQIDELSKEE